MKPANPPYLHDSSTGGKALIAHRSQTAAKFDLTREQGTLPVGGAFVNDESDRARLIGDLSRLILEPEVPESARTAGLELIGWLARRMPGESAHAVGVEEAALESERMTKPARRKPR
jgi:hypothetical protein